MVDALNAEVSLGTIANVSEAIQWLGYTYLFGQSSPSSTFSSNKTQFECARSHSYTVSLPPHSSISRSDASLGMPHDEPKDDPQLGNKRNELIVQAARQLSAAKMIRFEEITNTFVISDLGRIAAKYYLKYQTMEIFSK
jgi:antiviral helicase SLH1